MLSIILKKNGMTFTNYMSFLQLLLMHYFVFFSKPQQNPQTNS